MLKRGRPVVYFSPSNDRYNIGILFYFDQSLTFDLLTITTQAKRLSPTLFVSPTVSQNCTWRRWRICSGFKEYNLKMLAPITISRGLHERFDQTMICNNRISQHFLPGQIPSLIRRRRKSYDTQDLLLRTLGVGMNGRPSPGHTKPKLFPKNRVQSSLQSHHFMLRTSTRHAPGAGDLAHCPRSFRSEESPRGRCPSRICKLDL